MSQPEDVKVTVAVPAELVERVLTDMEPLGRRVPLSFRQLVSRLREVQDRMPAVPDKAPSERAVPS